MEGVVSPKRMLLGKRSRAPDERVVRSHAFGFLEQPACSRDDGAQRSVAAMLPRRAGERRMPLDPGDVGRDHPVGEIPYFPRNV